MISEAFEAYHPLVALAYSTGALCLVMTAFQPVYLVVACVCGFVCLATEVGAGGVARRLSWQLPLLAIVALLNPLFSASGSTLIASVGHLRVYAESLAYGVCFGMLLVASTTWFSCLSHALSTDEVLDVLGRALPTVALMCSMTMRQVPMLLDRGRQVDAALRANTAARVAGTHGPRFGTAVSSTLVGWALEDSLECADSMRSRGWGTGERTSYLHNRWHRRDVVLLAVLACLLLANVPLVYEACVGFTFFPTLTRLRLWLGYLPFALFLLLPLWLSLALRLVERD